MSVAEQEAIARIVRHARARWREDNRAQAAELDALVPIASLRVSTALTDEQAIAEIQRSVRDFRRRLAAGRFDEADEVVSRFGLSHSIPDAVGRRYAAYGEITAPTYDTVA